MRRRCGGATTLAQARGAWREAGANDGTPQFRRKRYGRFRPESVVLQAYQQMLASLRRDGQAATTDFLTASRAIATRLFDVMRQSPQNGSRPHPGTITPGDLLVGLFQGIAPQSVPEPWLFLIKVDLESALQRQIPAIWHRRCADDFNGT